MRHATRWLALLAALSYLSVMCYTGAFPERRHLVKFVAKGLLKEIPDRVDRVTISRNDRTRSFVRHDSVWREGDATVEAKTRTAIESGISYMYRSEPVRTIAPDDASHRQLADFGLDAPALNVRLYVRGSTVLEAAFGSKHPISTLDYVGMSGQEEVFLLSGFVREQWEAVLSSPGR